MGVIFSPLGKVILPRSSVVTLQPRHARGLLKDEVRSNLLAGQERRDLSMKLGPTWHGAGHEHSSFYYGSYTTRFGGRHGQQIWGPKANGRRRPERGDAFGLLRLRRDPLRI